MKEDRKRYYGKAPTFSAALLTTITYLRVVDDDRQNFLCREIAFEWHPASFFIVEGLNECGTRFFRCRASRSTKLIPTEMPESVIKSFHQTKITVINVACSIRKIWFRFLASVINTHNSHHPKKQRVIVLALHCFFDSENKQSTMNENQNYFVRRPTS